MGIKTDIGLKGDDYQWLSSMFYFGRPTSLRAGSAQSVDQQQDTSLGNTLRIASSNAFLSPNTLPSASSCGWYTKKEQGTRIGIWFSFNGWGQIFGGLVAYGIAEGSRLHGSAIAPWKIIFLVTGLLTAAVGVLFIIFIPDNQLNARWLSPFDRRLAIERVRVNQQGIGNKHFKMYQLKEALLDPLTWAFAFFALTADIPNGGISNFFSQLIVSFGYTPEQSLLYGTPGGAVEVVALVVCGYLGDRYGNRLLISSSGLLTSIIGMVLIVALPLSNAKGRLAGYYLTQSSPTVFVALLSLIATNVAGYTKKTTVAAIFLIAYCVGNIIGPSHYGAYG
ncbi:MAG: hypothetical protein L6R37_006561 [Teloschistes peruensis]|nr:MAG: hypothetical protein L6R37_006561 [Teloschistes peruensis]